MITSRDMKVMSFIEEFKVATTDTIQELFYPSLRVAQNRLKKLYDNKMIKRERHHFTRQYLYYIRKTKQLKHDLILSDFYREMSNILAIAKFKKEFAIANLRSDGLIAYRQDDKNYIAFIEVQISNIQADVNKYIKLYESEEYKKYFPVFPQVIIISDKKVKSYDDFKVIKIKEDLTDINKILL